MKLQDVTQADLALNLVNLINQCSPDDVIAILINNDDENDRYSDDRYIDIIVGFNQENCVSFELQFCYELNFQIYLAEKVLTDSGNLVECHIHVEDLTVEELIAECFNHCKRYGCLPESS